MAAKGGRKYVRDSRGRFAAVSGASKKTQVAGRSDSKPATGAKPRLALQARPSANGVVRRRRDLPVVNGKMSDQMKVELKSYKTENFKAINGYLRSGKPPAGWKESSIKTQVRSIDAAMKRGVTTRDAVVWRGVQGTNLGKIANSLVGKTLDSSAFVSTSASKSTAAGFAGFDGVLMKIKVPKGTKAVNMDKFQAGSGSAKGEREVLLGKGGKLTVTGVRKEGLRTVVEAMWSDPSSRAPRRKPNRTSRRRQPKPKP